MCPDLLHFAKRRSRSQLQGQILERGYKSFEPDVTQAPGSDGSINPDVRGRWSRERAQESKTRSSTPAAACPNRRRPARRCVRLSAAYPSVPLLASRRRACRAECGVASTARRLGGGLIHAYAVIPTTCHALTTTSFCEQATCHGAHGEAMLPWRGTRCKRLLSRYGKARCPIANAAPAQITSSRQPRARASWREGDPSICRMRRRLSLNELIGDSTQNGSAIQAAVPLERAAAEASIRRRARARRYAAAVGWFSGRRDRLE